MNLLQAMNLDLPPLELRHSFKIEFENSLSVDEKMEFFEKLRAEFEIEYLDIISIENSTNIIAKFVASELIERQGVDVEMYDRGRIEFFDKYMYVKIEFSFDRLVEIYEYLKTELGNDFRDLLIYHNENPKGTPTA